RSWSRAFDKCLGLAHTTASAGAAHVLQPMRQRAKRLRRANGSVKLAVLLLNGCSVDDGVRLIEQSNGLLREALARVRRQGGGCRVKVPGTACVSDDHALAGGRL